MSNIDNDFEDNSFDFNPPTNEIPGFENTVSERPSTHESASKPNTKKQNVLLIGLTAIILVIAVVFVILRQPRYNANDLLSRAHFGQDEFESAIVELDFDINMRSLGFSFNMPINLLFYIQASEMDDFNMKLDLSMDLFGMEMQNTTTYLRNGYTYTVENGVVSREFTGLDDNSYINSFHDGLATLENLVSDSRATRVSTGYLLEFTLDPSFLSGIMPDFDLGYSDSEDDLGLFDSFGDLSEASDVLLRIYLAEDYEFQSATLETYLVVSEMGLSSTLYLTAQLNVIQLGEVVIEFPEYLDNTEEIIEIVPDEIEENDDELVEEETLVGTWAWEVTEVPWFTFYENGNANNIEDGERFTWNEDGTFSNAIFYDTWEINDGILTITWSGGQSFDYFRIEE